MDSRGSYGGKRSFSDLQATCHRKPDEDDEMPVKKKLRTKLVDLFNRASLSLIAPEDHMKVYLRIKPYTNDEDSSQKCLTVTETENTVVAAAPELSHTFKSMKRGLGKSSHKFTFSRIFNDNTSQADFFNETMLSMTKDFISGQNSLVFTYGVTSSGKTYTIQGKPQDAGILPRCLDVIFNSINGKQIRNSTFKPRMFTDVVRLSPEEISAEKKIKEKTLRMSVDDDTTVMTLLGDEMESVLSDPGTSSSSASVEELLPDLENRDREELKIDVEDQGKIRFGVWVSFAEIYNEQIFDLLEPMPRKKNARRPVLKICDDRNGNPYIKGLKEIHVESADEAYRLLTIGQRNLQTACTRLNHCSSRSHCIFNIKIVRVMDKDDPHIARVSMLSLCDLAGSERYSKTQATGDRLKEAGNINTSLMTLGRCIETLRHNQLHRDQQRLVPFRDSKLTRLLQNFFNGSGRASMIVNVSQCAKMFDETLHVFKFSAIAKQVKYIEKPPEIPRPPKEKKAIPPPQRCSIAWETQEPPETILSETQNETWAEDDEIDENSEDDVDKMKAYIKTLEMRNERLVEMVQEEITNANSIETRVRQEVIQAMMQQVVNIEETYSTLLKETSEEAQELADERVKGIMEVYEQRLERIQRKVDEDDEWVSSLLFHQEQLKVQERDDRISDLEKQLAELKTESSQQKKNLDESDDIGNTMLIETLTQKLQQASDASKVKDGKIDELESLIAEAGEVYSKHVEEIERLTESTKQQKTVIEDQLSSICGLEKELKERTSSLESIEQSQKSSEGLWKTKEEEWMRKVKSQDATISSLQEECKELQDEIERLQDQMSQMDEQSRYRSELESSAASCNKLSTSNNSHGSEISQKVKSEIYLGDKETEKLCGHEQEPNRDPKGSTTMSSSIETHRAMHDNAEKENLARQVSQLQEDLQKKGIEVDNLEKRKQRTENELKSLQNENKELVSETKCARDNCEKFEAKLHVANHTIEELNKKIKQVIEKEKQLTSELDSLQQEKQKLLKEIESYQKLNDELTEKMHHLEEQMKSFQSDGKLLQSATGNVNITSLVQQIEQKTPSSEKSKLSPSLGEMNSDDSEIVFNPKSLVPASSLTPKVPKAIETEKAPEVYVSPQIAMKLKDAELANAALRNKLKREEEDFFKREQALIHGYTAEVENLKYEIAKLRSKADTSGRVRPRGQKKAAAMDTSSSALSESVCEKNNLSDLKQLHSNPEEGQSTALLSCELTSIQQQLFSLHAAYRKLQAVRGGNETNSFIQEVVMGTPGKRPSVQGVFRAEDNIADSVLQFEIEEYAIKLDEMRTKISDQEEERKTMKAALEKARREKEDIQTRLYQLQKQQELEKGEAESKLVLENTDLKEQVNLSVMTKAQLESCNKEHEVLITQLKETLENVVASKNDLDEKLSLVTKEFDSHKELLQKSEGELNQLKKTMITLTEERDQLKDRVANFSKEKHEADVELGNLRSISEQATSNVNDLKQAMEPLNAEVQSLKEDVSSKELYCATMESKLRDALREKESLEEKIGSLHEELSKNKEKLLKAEHKCKEMTEAVDDVSSKNIDLEGRMQNLKEKLELKEDAINQQKQEFENQLVGLKQQYCNEGETKAETITKLQQMLEDSKTQLKAKANEVETIKCQRQEEAAEVSQKIIMLEKEKKVAERRATEAKEREQEWQLKCQGQDKLKQLEEQLHVQLKTAADSVRKHSKKTSELMEEVAKKNKELEQLKEELKQLKEEQEQLKTELANSKTNSKTSEDLEQKIKELEQEISSEKEQKLRIQNNLQEYCKQIETLKTELAVSEETMEQQEMIINKQDGELESLRAELPSITVDKEKLDHLVTRKDLQIANLNRQISKLEEESRSLRQLEKRTFEVEQREKVSLDQLQKSNSEKGALEQRIQKLETEKQNLEEKLETTSTQKSQDMKEIEEKLINTEKQRKNLEKDVQRLTDKQDVLEEELEKAKKQKLTDLEHSQLLEAQLTRLKTEAEAESSEKYRQNHSYDALDKENKTLKEDLRNLKSVIECKEKELTKLQESMRASHDHQKTLERDLQKQERINQRNREEMENWKQERDSCVSKLEQLISRRQQENKQLSQENEQLKKDNAVLVQNVSNTTNMKDSVIADLKKTNNTLSIQLASVQGLSPPPKMETPDSSVFSRKEFVEDLDTAGHIEIDATPAIAAKKCRKRQGSLRQSHLSPSSSSSVDPEVFTPVRKSLKPIEEQNEGSPHTPGRASSPNKSGFQSAKGKVAELASEVMASISPLTRSTKRRQEKDSKKQKKTSIQAPFDLASYVATDDTQNENAHPYGTRRSSRLRTKSKHSVI